MFKINLLSPQENVDSLVLIRGWGPGLWFYKAFADWILLMDFFLNMGLPVRLNIVILYCSMGRPPHTNQFITLKSLAAAHLVQWEGMTVKNGEGKPVFGCFGCWRLCCDAGGWLSHIVTIKSWILIKSKTGTFKYNVVWAPNQESIKSKDLEIVSNCFFQLLMASLFYPGIQIL